MYFKNRAEAGRKLAKKLKKEYPGQQVVVVALTPGGLLVGAQIAMKMHANLAILLTAPIVLPGEPDPIASISSENTFTYNNMYYVGEITELMSEYFNLVEQQRLQKLSQLHQLQGADGEIDKKILRNHVVVLVSDGMSSGFALDAAFDFLKPIAYKRMIVATPIASPNALDRMHLLADEIVCLSMVNNYLDTNHYYDENDSPGVEDSLKIIKNISVNWDQ